MRYAPALLLMTACSSSVGPAGPAGPAGAAADPMALAVLVAKVTALEAELAAVRVAKVPWFVDGETHEPIGRVLDYSAKVAWSDELAAPVAAGSVPVYYSESGCKGEARVAGAVTRYVIAFDGVVVEPMPSVGDFAVASMRRRGGDCQDDARGPQPNYKPFVATGVTLPPTGATFLAVEMR